MTALAGFQFGQYLLRPAGAKSTDAQLAEQWTAADPDHAGKTSARFWLEQNLYTDSYLFYDRFGPVFFFKIVQAVKTAAEVHIQFPPMENGEARDRVMRAMADGLRWLERALEGNGVEEMYFDSQNENLIRFCVKRLGFKQEGHRLSRPIGWQAGVKS